MTLEPTDTHHIPALRSAIKDLETRIRGIKTKLRSTWEPGVSMADLQRTHRVLAETITKHLVLRAALRGRTHTKHRDDVWCQDAIRQVLHDLNQTTTTSHAAE